MADKENWCVIGRGKTRSWHAEKKDCSLQCCGGCPDELAMEAVDGALVYDADKADYTEFAKLIIEGPIVDCGLPTDGEDRFTADDRQSMLSMLPALGGAFKTYAIIGADPKFRGLDKVGVGIYEELLRKVPGMRIGHVLNGKIVQEGQLDLPTEEASNGVD